MPDNADSLEQLKRLRDAIAAFADPRRAANEWKQVYKLLIAAGQPAGPVGGVVGMRSLQALDEMLAQLQAPAAASDDDEPDDETCRKAYAAFKKRLALTVLDEESKLGHSPLTKGADASAAAIEPPTEWPQAVWQHLVRKGKLRYIGHGFYELASK